MFYFIETNGMKEEVFLIRELNKEEKDFRKAYHLVHSPFYGEMYVKDLKVFNYVIRLIKGEEERYYSIPWGEFDYHSKDYKVRDELPVAMLYHTREEAERDLNFIKMNKDKFGEGVKFSIEEI